MSALPDRIDPVVGWRVWALCPAEPSLGESWQWSISSPYASREWAPRVAAPATCHRCPEAPGSACGCGVYAFLTGPFVEDVPQVQDAWDSDRWPGTFHDIAAQQGCVIGQVAGWGRVIEHRKGWRAERAYPLSLAVICVGCLLTLGRFERAAGIYWSDRGTRFWATCGRHKMDDLARAAANRVTDATEAEAKLLARYEVPRAELPFVIRGDSSPATA
jgi:hypothetical protein